MPHVRALSTTALAITFVAAAWLSTLEQSAAAMFLWPTCLAYVAFFLAPLAGVGAGAFDPGGEQGGLSGPWWWAVVATVVAVVAAVLASPFRAESAIWAGVPLGGVAVFMLVARSVNRPISGLRLAQAMGASGAVVSAVSLVMWTADQLARLNAAEATGETLPTSALGWIGWWFAARNSQPLGHVNYTGGSALLFLPWLVWLAVGTKNAREKDGENRVSTSDGPEGGFPASPSRSFVLSPSSAVDRLSSIVWCLSFVLCFLMLLSSGSRGAWLGTLAAAGGAVLLAWRQYSALRRRLFWTVIAAVAVGGGVAFVHPALRSSLRPRTPEEMPNPSNAERQSMMSVGWHMGLDRPWTGWGPGAVPLAYDRFRGAEHYGPINMLQVHSTPLNLWAEGGLLFVGAAAAVLALAARAVWRAGHRREYQLGSPRWPATIALLGYTVFGFTDYQLDLPLVALGVAVALGVLAGSDSKEDVPEGNQGNGATIAAAARPKTGETVPGRNRNRLPWVRAAVVAVVLAGLAWVAVPWLRARRALAEGQIDEAVRLQPRDSALRVMRGLMAAERARGMEQDESIRNQLLRTAQEDLQSAMAGGAHQEVGHFELGWLDLDAQPARARSDFAAVLALAPSRSGAWLGLALSSLANGDEPAAVDALAMELLAHPEFLTSGWWLTTPLAPHRAAAMAALEKKLARVAAGSSAGVWPAPQAWYYGALVRWLEGRGQLSAVADAADTPERRQWIVALAVGRDAPATTGPRAAVLGEEGARQRLAGQLRRITGRPPDPVAVARLLAVVRDLAPEVMVQRGLAPAPGRALPMVTIYVQRSGFGVRQRNPYAQRVRECMPQIRSPLAECFLGGLLLPPGWLYEDELRRLALK